MRMIGRSTSGNAGSVDPRQTQPSAADRQDARSGRAFSPPRREVAATPRFNAAQFFEISAGHKRGAHMVANASCWRCGMDERARPWKPRDGVVLEPEPDELVEAALGNESADR